MPFERKWLLILAQEDLFKISDLQSHKIINLCYSKPLRLWSSVIAAIETNTLNVSNVWAIWWCLQLYISIFLI